MEGRKGGREEGGREGRQEWSEVLLVIHHERRTSDRREEGIEVSGARRSVRPSVRGPSVGRAREREG